jgi:hypothetical protein
MSQSHLQKISLLGGAVLIAACSQPPQKPPAADPPAAASPTDSQRKAAKNVEPARVGTVGLIRELKDRGMSAHNWASVIGSVFTNETEADVIRVRYEVTVFYKDGNQGVVIVNERPSVQTGQRVRVIGDRIEPLEQ